MEMTRHDIKNYLEKIYNIDIIEVRTRIAMGKFVRDRLQGAVIKEDDRKLAYIVLVRSQLFLIFLFKKKLENLLELNFVAQGSVVCVS